MAAAPRIGPGAGANRTSLGLETSADSVAFPSILSPPEKLSWSGRCAGLEPHLARESSAEYVKPSKQKLKTRDDKPVHASGTDEE